MVGEVSLSHYLLIATWCPLVTRHYALSQSGILLDLIVNLNDLFKVCLGLKLLGDPLSPKLFILCVRHITNELLPKKSNNLIYFINQSLTGFWGFGVGGAVVVVAVAVCCSGCCCR